MPSVHLQQLLADNLFPPLCSLEAVIKLNQVNGPPKQEAVYCKMKIRQGTVISSLVCLQTRRPNESGASNRVLLCHSQAKENRAAYWSELSILSMQEKSEN